MHTTPNRFTFISALLAFIWASGCTNMDETPVTDSTAQAQIENAVGIDELDQVKSEPGEEDLVALYDPDKRKLTVVEGYQGEAIESLQQAELAVSLNEIKITVVHGFPQLIDILTSNRVCRTEYYSVYKNAACGAPHWGYSFVYNNTPQYDYQTVGTRATYYSCSYCRDCGFCVARRNPVIGEYKIYDDQGFVDETGELRASEACWVGPF